MAVAVEVYDVDSEELTNTNHFSNSMADGRLLTQRDARWTFWSPTATLDTKHRKGW